MWCCLVRQVSLTGCALLLKAINSIKIGKDYKLYKGQFNWWRSIIYHLLSCLLFPYDEKVFSWDRRISGDLLQKFTDSRISKIWRGKSFLNTFENTFERAVENNDNFGISKTLSQQFISRSRRITVTILGQIFDCLMVQTIAGIVSVSQDILPEYLARVSYQSILPKLLTRISHQSQLVNDQ